MTDQFAIQSFCKHLERINNNFGEDHDGWLTLIRFDTHAEAMHIFTRPYGDGLKRKERVIDTTTGEVLAATY